MEPKYFFGVKKRFTFATCFSRCRLVGKFRRAMGVSGSLSLRVHWLVIKSSIFITVYCRRVKTGSRAAVYPGDYLDSACYIGYRVIDCCSTLMKRKSRRTYLTTRILPCHATSFARQKLRVVLPGNCRVFVFLKRGRHLFEFLLILERQE